MSKYPESGILAALDMTEWSPNVAIYLRDSDKMDRSDDKRVKSGKDVAKSLDKQVDGYKLVGKATITASKGLKDVGRQTQRAGKEARTATVSFSKLTERMLQLDIGIRLARQAAGVIQSLGTTIDSVATKAAQAETIAQAFGNITAGMGGNDPFAALRGQTSVLDTWREQTQNGISDLELMRQANVALINLSDESADVIGNNFGTVIQGAIAGAAASGNDFDMILDKMVKGVRRQSNMLLDDIGVWVVASEAQDRYAEANGLVVSSMTEAQKAAAWQAEAIRQMGEIMEQTGAVAVTASQKAAVAWENAMNALAESSTIGIRKIDEAVSEVSLGFANLANELAPYIGDLVDIIGDAATVVASDVLGLLDDLDPEAFWTGGANIIAALAEGMLSGLVYVIQAANVIAQSIANFLIGFSPPVEGPLSTIDIGGENVIESWISSFNRVSRGPVHALAGEVRDILGSVTDLATKDQITVLEQLQNRVNSRLKGTVGNLMGGANNAAEVRALDKQREQLNDHVDLLRERYALERAGLNPETFTSVKDKIAKASGGGKGSTAKTAKGSGTSLESLQEELLGLSSGGGGILPAEGPSAFRQRLSEIFGGVTDEYDSFIAELQTLKGTLDGIHPFEAIENFITTLQGADGLDGKTVVLTDLLSDIAGLPGDILSGLVQLIGDLIGAEIPPELIEVFNVIGTVAGGVLIATALQSIAGGIAAVVAAGASSLLALGPLGILLGLLFYIENEFGGLGAAMSIAWDTVQGIIDLMELGFYNLRRGVGASLDNLLLDVFTFIDDIDSSLEDLGIDLGIDVTGQIEAINWRQDSREIQDMVAQDVVDVLAGRDFEIDPNLAVQVNENGVDFPHDARVLLNNTIEQAMNQGDYNNLELYVQVADVYGVEVSDAARLALQNSVNADIAANPLQLTISAEFIGMVEATTASVKDGTFTPVFEMPNNELFTGGETAGNTWASGMTAAGPTVEAAAALLAQNAADQLVGQSPPPKGPLSTIDKGGTNVANAWIAGFANADMAPVESFAQQIMTLLGADAGLGVASTKGTEASGLDWSGSVLESIDSIEIRLLEFIGVTQEQLPLFAEQLILTDDELLALNDDTLLMTQTTDGWSTSILAAEGGIQTLSLALQKYHDDMDHAAKITDVFAKALAGIPTGLASLNVHYQWEIPYGGARAEGGDVHPGSVYKVGEEGEEWFAPNQSGTIIPNHLIPSMQPKMAPPPIYVNVPPPVVIDGRGSGATVNQNFYGQTDANSMRRTAYELSAAEVY